MEKVIGIVIAIAIGVGIYTMKQGRQEDSGQLAHDDIVSVLESMPNWDTHQQLYMEWLDAHHEAVFDKHYKQGSRRVAASFDDDAYWADLLSAMATDAKQAGYDECAGYLDEAADFDG